jgi:hypothetical protein
MHALALYNEPIKTRRIESTIVQSPASALHRRFEQLFDCEDPSERGRAFEKLLHDRLRLDGFRVEADARTAAPRQTDLFARFGSADYVIEAKWQSSKIDIADIDNLRVRLQRTAGDIIGCFFSMSDYTDTAINQVTQERTREILLFNAAEMNAIFAHRIQINDLIKRKRDALRIQAQVCFMTPGTQSTTDMAWPTPRYEFIVNSAPTPWLHCHTNSDDTAFLLSLPEISRSGTCVRLNLRIEMATPEELASLFSVAVRDIGLSNEGTFAIHQGTHAWYGFGINQFLTAIQSWKDRYEHAGLADYHHSEELAYFDSLNGKLLAITARQRVGDSVFLHSSEIELHLPGIPIKPTGLQRLCDATHNQEAYLETVHDMKPDETRCEKHKTPVTAIAQITATIQEEETVVAGIVIKNPFYGENALVAPEGQQKYSALPHLAASEFLICDLDQWHDTNDQVQQYFVRQVSAMWVGHMPLLDVMCTWDSLVSPRKPRRSRVEFGKLAERLMREYEDSE